MGTERHQFTLEPGEAAASAEVAPPPTTSNLAAAAFNEGLRAYEARDYEVARAKLEQAAQHDPKLRQAWTMLSQVHLAQKRYQEAADAAEKAIALGAGGPSILLARWEAYRHLDDPARTQRAREELDKAGSLQEEAKRIHNTGVALVKIGNDQEAYAKFQEAVGIDPNLEQSWLALAVTGLKIGRAAEAAAAAARVLESNAHHEEALRLRYNAALQSGDEGKIVEALVALAAIEPGAARDNLFRLAVKAVDADDAPLAKKTLREVLAIDPNHARANYYLGILLVRDDAKSEARAHLQRFLRLTPNDPDAGTAKGLIAFLGN
jgi:tetratricopeptide (TPR) repeat protein